MSVSNMNASTLMLFGIRPPAGLASAFAAPPAPAASEASEAGQSADLSPEQLRRVEEAKQQRLREPELRAAAEAYSAREKQFEQDNGFRRQMTTALQGSHAAAMQFKAG